jgi:hypothetical protein
VLIVAAGLGLRLGYFLNGDPFVDEWATMLVARGIWERGLPFLPSGSFYGHGMLFSYLDAVFLALLGWTPVVAQLPSLIAGLLTIPLTYVVGRRLFGSSEYPGTVVDKREWDRRWRGEAVGLLAAALLALDPNAIIWAGRARAYTLQQMLVLLAILLLYRRRYLLFALAFVGAVFSHAEAALLLPGFAVGLLLLEGRAVLRQPGAWLAMGLSGAAVLVRFFIHRLILVGGGEQLQPVDSRPALALSLDIVAGFKPLLPYFAEPHRVLVSALFLVGLVFAVRAWQRRDRTSGYLLLYPLILVALVALLTVVGQSWKDPRYLFMLLPAFFVVAGASAVDLLTWALDRPGIPAWLKIAAAVALTGLLLIPPVPEALDTANKLEEGYGPALAYVREHWQDPIATTGGDRVAGWAVPAIAVELGQIDYFAMQIRHEEFIMQKDGVWVDRWVGAPLMDSVEQLQTALDEPGRLWFLTDEFRFRARYTPEFAQAIWDRMVPVYRYHNALVFVEDPAYKSDAPQSLPASYHRELQVGFEQGLDLMGYELEPGVLQPGDTLTSTLHWQARDWVPAAYTAFVHLLDPQGHGIAQADGPPFGGLHPTDHWLPGERLRDERQLKVPNDAVPGLYRLEVGWYDPVTLDRLPLVDGGDSLLLAYVPVGQIGVEEPGTYINATLGEQVELVGFDLWRDVGGQWTPLAEGEPVASGDRLQARLVWRALVEMDLNYTVFVHLEGPGDEFWAQHDGQPGGGGHPTSYWRPGELVVDEHELVVSEAAAGRAPLLAGMYLLDTMERMGEAVLLRQIEVGP